MSMTAAFRLVAAVAATLAAGSSAQAQLRLPQVARPAPPATARPAPPPPKPAPLSAAQLSKAMAAIAPNLPPPDLTKAVHLTWDAPATPAAWLGVRGGWVETEPGKAFASSPGGQSGEVFFRAEADKTYLVDCSVRRNGVPGAAPFTYVVLRDEKAYPAWSPTISANDHVLFAVPPGFAAVIHVVFGAQDAPSGWSWYGCDIAPLG